MRIIRSGSRGSRRGSWVAPAVFSAMLVISGLVVVVIGQHTHRWAPPPAPPPPAALLATPTVSGGAATGLAGAPLPRSSPVSVRIPAIGVAARIIPVGLNANRTVQVPSLRTPFLAGWFDGGSAPGQTGPAVLLGHVDSALVGPAVFYRLGELRPGNLVYVTRDDQHVAVFSIDSVARYPQWDFPSKQVYGFTARPTLRLITCGGDFDTHTHLYLDRTIAFATYVGQEKAGPTRTGGA